MGPPTQIQKTTVSVVKNEAKFDVTIVYKGKTYKKTLEEESLSHNSLLIMFKDLRTAMSNDTKFKTQISDVIKTQLVALKTPETRPAPPTKVGTVTVKRGGIPTKTTKQKYKLTQEDIVLLKAGKIHEVLSFWKSKEYLTSRMGGDVAKFQAVYNWLIQNEYVKPKKFNTRKTTLKVDGVRGSNTRSAIKNLQFQINDLAKKDSNLAAAVLGVNTSLKSPHASKKFVSMYKTKSSIHVDGVLGQQTVKAMGLLPLFAQGALVGVVKPPEPVKVVAQPKESEKWAQDLKQAQERLTNAKTILGELKTLSTKFKLSREEKKWVPGFEKRIVELEKQIESQEETLTIDAVSINFNLSELIDDLNDVKAEWTEKAKPKPVKVPRKRKEAKEEIAAAKAQILAEKARLEGQNLVVDTSKADGKIALAERKFKNLNYAEAVRLSREASKLVTGKPKLVPIVGTTAKTTEGGLVSLDLIIPKKPTEKPKEKPTETPKEKPTETPKEKPTETPKEKPTETPKEKPTEKPTDDDV